MNKRFLLAAALCAAMNLTSFAQTNLAQGKAVKASSEKTAELAAYAVDGDFNTRWQVDADDKESEAVDATNDYTVTKGHWIYVDLGEEQDFNTIRVKWEGAYAKAFKILVANEFDEDTQEPKWQDEAVFSKEETLTDFTQYYTYSLDKTVKARYVKLQGEKMGYAGNWFSLYEFGIYNIDAAQKTPVITKMTTTTPFVQPGENFSVNVTDQFDQAMTTGITYDLTNATQQADGTFKADADGEVIIKATDEKGNSKTVKVYALTETPDTPTLADGDMPVFLNDETGLEVYNSAWEGGYASQKIMDFNGNKVWCVKDVITFGLRKAISDTGYATLNFDIFPTTEGTTPYIFLEGTGKAKFEKLDVNLKAGEWNHISLDVKGAKAYNGYIKFKLVPQDNADNKPSILLDNVYYAKDTETTGIKDINAVDAAKAGNVYSVDGKLVKANANSTEGLAKGVYVINGKKYIIK